MFLMTRALRAVSRRGSPSHYRLMTMYVCHYTLQARFANGTSQRRSQRNAEVCQEALISLMSKVKNVKHLLISGAAGSNNGDDPRAKHCE